MSRLWRGVREELGALHPRLLLARLVLAPAPDEGGGPPRRPGERERGGLGKRGEFRGRGFL